MARRTQAVFYRQRFATHIKAVAPRGFAFLGCESVRELAAVVCQQFDDLHRRGLLQARQKIHAAVLALIGVNPHEHPAGCAVDSHEQIAPLTLVGHLRQVLDVHVQETWLVVLEGLDRRLDFSSIGKRLGLKVSQVAHAVAAQASIQPGA